MNYNVQIWRKPGTPPMEFSIEAENINDASEKVHSLKKFRADQACEIRIKGGPKKATVDPIHEFPLEGESERMSDELLNTFLPAIEEGDERQTSVIPDDTKENE